MRTKTKLYSNCGIGRILEIARMYSKDPSVRTKKGLAKSLGITIPRLDGIEKGRSEIPLQLALDWCDAVGDATARDMIEHIYGIDLPPVDPRLLDNAENQIINCLRELEEAIKAVERLADIMGKVRPWQDIPENKVEEILDIGREVLGAQHASASLLKSITKRSSVTMQEIERRWILKTMTNEGVLVSSIDSFEDLRRKQVH
jgi:hypothetical protein